MAEAGGNSKAGLVSALNGALADTVALYFKTKNFHWHVAGPRFRDLHVLFDEQAAQLVGTVDDLGDLPMIDPLADSSTPPVVSSTTGSTSARSVSGSSTRRASNRANVDPVTGT